MKGVDVEEPWNVIEDPPCGKGKPILPVEGTWRLIGHENFDAFLSAVGVTPLVAIMVLRSDTMVTIYEDLDKQWKILSETSIKAKSIRGYKTRNFKLTSNKFKLNEAKPELLEDWDPRLVVTTVTHDADERLILDQVAEKDQRHCRDSCVIWEGKGDLLTQTCTVYIDGHEPVVALRRFVRHKAAKTPQGRKLSAPF